MMGGREERGREERRAQVQGRIIDTEAPVACGGVFFFFFPYNAFSEIANKIWCTNTHTHT